MISREKIETMLTLQNQLNAKINPDWLTANYPWHRAIMVEGVEALEHYGWKWWKKQEPDLAQARIELVDIWHFILSDVLCSHSGDVPRSAEFILEWYGDNMVRMAAQSTADKLEYLIGSAANRRINNFAFLGLMNDFGLSWDKLYTTYIAKNVLNMFRQQNGYKDGTYQKMWDGREDNVCLDILLEAKPDATPEQLMDKLKQIYTQLFYKAAA